MKRQIKLIIIIIIAHTQVLAQLPNPCDSDNYKTNPQSPIDLRGQPYINEITPGVPKFDWLQEWLPNYFNYHGTYDPNQLLNPFWDVNNSNLAHLAHQTDESFRDNRPEDGWELITFSLGTYYTINNQTNELEEKRQPDNHPYFVLYNKFTGIMRIFVYFNKELYDGNPSTGYIKIYPQVITGNRAALFQHFEVNTQPLVEYDAQIDHEGTVVNRNLTVGDGQWMYADFAMSYDPCVCEFEYSDILFDAYIIEEAQLDIEGFLKLHTTGNMYLDINGYVNQGGGSNNPHFQTIGKAAKAGQTAYKTTSAIITIIEAAAIIASKGTATPLVLKKLAASKAAKAAAKGVKAAPYVAGAIGIIDFMVGGSKKTTFNGTAKGEVFLTTSGEISLTGSIIKQHKLIKERPIHVPGSKLPASPPAYNRVPKYNEPLGVFTMLEPPVIKYVQYSSYTNPTHDYKVRQYKVDQLPVFKLNPSSGLEIEEMKVSLVLDYAQEYNDTVGQFQTNKIYPDLHHNHPSTFEDILNRDYYSFEKYGGFNLEKEILDASDNPLSIRLTLGQIPIGCFENTSFYLNHWNNLINNEPVILKIRFNLILKETESGFLHQAIHVYDIPNHYIMQDEQQNPSEDFPFGIIVDWNNETLRPTAFINTTLPAAGSGFFPSYYPEKNTNTLDYIILEDTLLEEGTYMAWELISIGDNVTLQGNSSFYSYGEIFMMSNNHFTPEKIFSTSFPDAGCYENPMNYNTEDVSSFCQNDNKYNPIRNKTTPDLDIDTTPIVKTFDFKLYPNPTRNAVNVELPEVAEGGAYDISVMDITGQMMKEFNIRPSETIGSVYEMDVSHLSAGIYFVRLVIDGEAKVKRLVIL